MKNKQTAVSWLIEQLKGKSQSITWNEIFNKAKDIEEQQIIDAYNSGQQIPPFDFAEQYYNETFKK